MSQNRLGIASVVLVVLLGLTFFRMNARQDEVKAPPKVEVKLPKIERDKIDELELAAPEKDKVRLVKKGDEWRLSEPLDARADQDSVKSALDKLGELEVTGVAATKAANHERLEVDAKKGTHVIARSAGKPVLDAWIGTYQSGNSMLRLEGQEPVATVKGSIRYAFSRAAREWRDRAVSKFETKDAEEMIFDNKGTHLDFVRSGDDWKQVVGKREKLITPLDQSKVKGVLGTASSVNANDFAEPGVTAEQAGLTAAAATVTIKLGNDAGPREVVFRLGNEKDQNRYLQREGVDTLYLVSTWVAGRLMPTADSFLKKDPPAAAAGSPDNPIPVEAMGHGMPGMPPGMQGLPPGMQGLPPGLVAGTPHQAMQAQAAHPTPPPPGQAPKKPAAAAAPKPKK